MKKTSDKYHKRNADDLNTLLQRLSHGAVAKIRPGQIFGPFGVPGAPLFTAEIDLFIGKVSRNLRVSSADNEA